MRDIETTAVLRAVLNEVCANLALSDITTRTRVASRLLETAQQGLFSIDDLKQAGKKARRRHARQIGRETLKRPIKLT